MLDSTEKDISKISALRTLKTDTAEYVKKSGMSLVDIVAAEAAATGSLKFKEITKKPSFKIIVIAAMAVIIGAGAVGYFLFKNGAAKEPKVVFLTKPIIAPDEQVEFVVDFSANDNIKKIKNFFEKPSEINKLLYIALVKQEGGQKRLATTREFFQLSKADLPSELFDSLDDKFMFAKFYFSKDWPILIFKIQSYEYAFSGMLKWEKQMTDDLAEIFSFGDISEIQNVFKDREIQNHDTRLLLDKNENPVLFYSFINRDYLVITTGEEPLKEIFRRFSSPQYLSR